MKLAISEAEKCVNQYSDREDPKVGGVVVSADGKLIASAHRGEPVNGENSKKAAGDHCEFTLLIKKCKGRELKDATVFTTLEPCTSRSHGKMPCAEHLINADVRRVIIGMVDPNPLICGRGIGRLRSKGIDVMLFPDRYANMVETQNKKFSLFQRGPQAEILSPSEHLTTIRGETTTVRGRLSRTVRSGEKLRCFIRKHLTVWPQLWFRIIEGARPTWECDLHLQELIEYEFLITKVSTELEAACKVYEDMGKKTKHWAGFEWADVRNGMQILERRSLIRVD